MKITKEQRIKQLEKELRGLKKENTRLRRSFDFDSKKPTVRVPHQFRQAFDKAEKLVGDYFKSLTFVPSKGSIEINKQRYVLVRASALSHEFLNSIKHLYSDRGEEEALNIGKNILFDMAHVLGLEDARNFHKKMKLKDPISRLSAGPVHFAYTGWAFVDILPESHPSPDENYFIKYNHPYSFEADSWIRDGKKSDTPVCIMNAGYSSGWCEACFGVPLTAVEITCRAKGDKHCTFIMAPPHKVDTYLQKTQPKKIRNKIDIPAFLERKKIEEKLESSIREKEFLIKEIHHRVKNNLQIVSSLLNLQAESISDSDAREKYTESIGRIKSMAIIHELLYRSKDLSNIRIRDYLEELVSFISNTYNDNRQIGVRLRVDIEHKHINLDKAIPCGIIINELLSNAFKYAFTEKEGGRVDVEFIEENGQYTLRVSDNGVGLSSAVDIHHSDTLGLQLINSLVEQLAGAMRIDRKKGTSFVISFK